MPSMLVSVSLPVRRLPPAVAREGQVGHVQPGDRLVEGDDDLVDRRVTRVGSHVHNVGRRRRGVHQPGLDGVGRQGIADQVGNPRG